MHADLSPDGDRIVLDATWQETELLKLVPGVSYKKKVWSLPLTWGSMVILRGVFRDAFTYGDALLRWTWKIRENRVDPSLELRTLVEWPAGSDPSGLYSFQRAGVEWMDVAGSGLLGDELGVGKTPQALVYIHENKLLPAVVICPNNVKFHWAKRVARWCPNATPYVVQKGTASGRKVLKQAAVDPTALVIVNYESVRLYSRLAPYGSIKLKRCRECDPKHGDDIKSTQCHVHPKELNKLDFQAVIIDEAHRIGNPQTLQTRAIWAVAHKPTVRHRWALTGTPDNIQHLWSIMHAVSPDEYPTRGSFMDRYALQAWNAFGGMDIIGIRPDTREELYRILDPRFRRMLKEVVLPQLPPIVRQVRYAVLSTAQQRMYDELEKQLFTRLPNGELFVSQNKLVSRTRLMQFAAGTVHVEKPDPDDVSSWNVGISEPSPKMDTLTEVLQELGPKPFVVACEHLDVTRMIGERLADLNIRHQFIVGGVKPEVAEEACEDLKTGRLRAIVFTSKAGGTGLDMSGADTLIRVQRSWSLITNVQVEGRPHRIGSEIHESINVIDIVTQGTIEERQVERLYQKYEVLEEITRDRKQVRDRLAVTPFTSEEFSQLVAKLDALNHERDRILSEDDLDELRSEEA